MLPDEEESVLLRGGWSAAELALNPAFGHKGPSESPAVGAFCGMLVVGAWKRSVPAQSKVSAGSRA